MATAVTLGALVAPAQPPAVDAFEAARTRQLLQSPRLADRAWGAYYAGRLHQTDVIPILSDALREAAAQGAASVGSEGYAYTQSLLDALIELGANVPGETIQPFLDTRQAEALILLARSEKNEERLLAARESVVRYVPWITVNNLLLKWHSAVFFARTLREAGASHRFYVNDPGTGSGGGTGFGVGCGGGATFTHGPPAGFPPLALFQLDIHPTAGDTFLVAGPQSVYYRRVVVPAGASGVIPEDGPISYRSMTVFEFLAEATHRKVAEVTLLMHSSSSLVWTTAGALAQEANARLNSQEANIRGLMDSAKEAGFRNLPTIDIHIAVEIVDNRKASHDSLPAIGARDFVVN